jgi:hypothetical protein
MPPPGLTESSRSRHAAAGTLRSAIPPRASLTESSRSRHAASGTSRSAIPPRASLTALTADQLCAAARAPAAFAAPAFSELRCPPAEKVPTTW